MMMLTYFLTTLLVLGLGNGSVQECVKREDCDLEGALCVNSTCVCPPGFVANSIYTKCLILSNGYGSACADNVQCSKSLNTGGICFNGTCICSEGYHYLIGQCWKTSGLREKCKHNESCFVSNDFESSICTEKHLCACAHNYYQREYSSCRRESYKQGEPCAIHLDCKFENSVCTRERKCELKNSTTSPKSDESPSDLNPPASKNKVGGECTTNNDCPENAWCDGSKTCSCNKGYFTSSSHRCSPEIGSSCKTDGDCTGSYTMCRNSTYCVCKQGFVALDNNQGCQKLSLNIGWSCLNNKWCSLLGPGGECVKKKCHCNENTHFVEEELYCWVTKGVGGSCHVDEDCGLTKSMICEGKRCKCSSGTHPSPDKKSCRNNSNEIGMPCTDTVDCSFDFSSCNKTSHKCECKPGYIVDNGICISGIGGFCDNNTKCTVEESFCKNGTCTCEETFVSSRNFDKCLPVADTLNDTCSESEQCFKIEGVCSNGTCICDSPFHYVEGYKCFKSRSLKESCITLGNCKTAHSFCLKGFCECQYGYRSQLNGTICKGASVINQFSTFLIVVCLYLIYICINQV